MVIAITTSALQLCTHLLVAFGTCFTREPHVLHAHADALLYLRAGRQGDAAPRGGRRARGRTSARPDGRTDDDHATRDHRRRQAAHAT